MYWEVGGFYNCLLQSYGYNYLWLSVDEMCNVVFGIGDKIEQLKIDEKDVPEKIRMAVKEYMSSEFFEIDKKRFLDLEMRR